MTIAHNARVRSLVNDAFVSVGLTGIVTSIGQDPPPGGVRIITIRWDNGTSAKVPIHTVEVLPST